MGTMVDIGRPHELAAGGGHAGRKLLLGLIGAGIQGSLTPALHEAEAAHHGLRVHYQLIDLDRAGVNDSCLPGLLQAARIMGFAGLNITYPCKQTVIRYLDEISPMAEAIGAVNTVVLREGRWTGYNTDASGWVWGFRRALPEADLSRVLLLGAGGAGAAIAHAVADLGVETLWIADQDPARAAALAQAVGRRFPDRRVSACHDVHAAMQAASGLIHATPTGMEKLPGIPVDPGWLHPGLWVSEVVYFPLETALLRAAKAAGCAVVDGGGMAVGQALGAFELFTGLKANEERMLAHFRQLLDERGQ